jgi:hypothetical protein
MNQSKEYKAKLRGKYVGEPADAPTPNLTLD